MITDESTDIEIAETYALIAKKLLEHGVVVRWTRRGGQHQCCLAFDNRVLFAARDIVSLPYAFKMWCDEHSEGDGRIVPF